MLLVGLEHSILANCTKNESAQLALSANHLPDEAPYRLPSFSHPVNISEHTASKRKIIGQGCHYGSLSPLSTVFYLFHNHQIAIASLPHPTWLLNYHAPRPVPPNCSPNKFYTQITPQSRQLWLLEEQTIFLIEIIPYLQFTNNKREKKKKRNILQLRH